jgi:hypothetical protein
MLTLGSVVRRLVLQHVHRALVRKRTPAAPWRAGPDDAKDVGVFIAHAGPWFGGQAAAAPSPCACGGRGYGAASLIPDHACGVDNDRSCRRHGSQPP